MKKIIYLGMNNTPFEIFESVTLQNFKPTYSYKNNNDKNVMLKATRHNHPYFKGYNYEQRINYSLPLCKQNEIYPINILDMGYSGHYFELVEV